jgi:trk system potassium uptake protein TrkA
LARAIREAEVLVIGLGRFGGSLAEALVDLGHEVLGVDADPRIVQRFADRLTYITEADSTDEETMRQLGAGEFRRAVVGIGTDVEASILTTSVLVDSRCPTSGPRPSSWPTAASWTGSAPTT